VDPYVDRAAIKPFSTLKSKDHHVESAFHLYHKNQIFQSQRKTSEVFKPKKTISKQNKKEQLEKQANPVQKTYLEDHENLKQQDSEQ